MNRRSSNYEQLYGVGLLDDLHNYFPALLYDSDSFRTVQDVLQYVSLQTRRRFDLYSYALSAYDEMNERETRASGGAGSSNTVDYQFFRQSAPRQTSSDIPTTPPPVAPASGWQPSTTQSSARSPNAPRTNTTTAQPTDRLYRYVVDLGDEQFDIGEHHLPNINSVMSPTMLTTLLSGLVPRMRTSNRVDELSSVASLLLRLGQTNATMQGLDPVIIRPTAEQIARATEIANPDTEHDCAICQDAITTSQQCRRILHCGHWFHKDCIDPWFRQNVQCPICRYDIRDYRANEQQQELRQTFPEEDYH